MTTPAGLPRRYRRHWRRPWTWRARHNRGFKRWLRRHGYLAPHFTLAEARCKDGTDVPASLMGQAQRHAFKLEKFRHELGDRPVAITSWYRTPAHNAAVGGASQSRHMQADATDHPVQWVNSIGRQKVLDVANRVFANGGLGIYPAGSIHTDTRGWRARWTSF